MLIVVTKHAQLGAPADSCCVNNPVRAVALMRGHRAWLHGVSHGIHATSAPPSCVRTDRPHASGEVTLQEQAL